MSEICVKYQVTDREGRVLPEHSTYSHSFATVEEAEEWMYREGDIFTESCYIDSKIIGGDWADDELLIVRVNGFPVEEEEVLA